MDRPNTPKRSISYGSPFDLSPAPPALPMKSEIGQSAPAPYVNSENRGPPPLPTAWNSMLKNTTEMGDIGQFAIKNPRIPPRFKSPRKVGGDKIDHTVERPSHTFQLPTAQRSDDRKRLPSYSRDTTSEIVSLYQTASQKSPGSRQVVAQADLRSSSMTQTSYLPHDLSYHRSYTSLRSQPELNLVPRPRSPFPYPARLKRLGFRPTSPILHDEVGINNSQQPELIRPIDRAGNGGSSTSSSYPRQRENLPLAYRPDANRSNSSLHTLPSQQPDLVIRGSNAVSPQGVENHPVVVARKASPARSNLSSASTSTANITRSRPAISNLPTPGKLHTPSPLYYDYTEDFSVENALPEDPPPMLPALPFLVDEGILQGSKISTPSISPKQSALRAKVGDPNEESTIVTARNMYSAVDVKSALDSENDPIELSTNVTQDIIPLYFDRGPYTNVTPSKAINIASTSAGSSDGSTHRPNFSKADSMDDSAQFLEFMAENGLHSKETSPETRSCKSSYCADKAENQSISDRESTLRLSTYLPRFPGPPVQTVCVDIGVSTLRSQGVHIVRPYGLASPVNVPADKNPPDVVSSNKSRLNSDIVPAQQQSREFLPTSIPKRAASADGGRVSSSRSHSIDHGLRDLAHIVTKFDGASFSFASTDSYAQVAHRTSRRPLYTLPPPRMPQRPFEFPNIAITPPVSRNINRPFLSKSRSAGDLRASGSTMGKFNTYPPPVTDQDFSRGYGDKTVWKSYHTIGYQKSQKSLAGSGPPMLAPVPISPVRVLKLKNSVPQLMKALPPVPPASISTASSSPQRPPPSKNPSRFPPVLPDREPNSTDIPMSQDGQQTPAVDGSPQVVNNFAQSGFRLPTPKFKLRSRLGSSQPSASSPSSRPWNQDENYPWSSQPPTIRLASILSNEGREEGTPKFKLKVTRASKLPSGTVRINPEARRRSLASDLDFRQPKDLFTASASLSGIFRQVGKHFSSRKNSIASETLTGRDTNASFNVLGSTQVEMSQGRTQGSGTSLSATAYPVSPTEARSFFSDDSSQVCGHNSFRKRVSNLRARFPNPYAARSASQSCDNLAWRSRMVDSTTINMGHPEPDPEMMPEDEYGMPLTEVRSTKLRSKVSLWFKEARVAFRRHLRERSSDERLCIPIHR